MKEFDALKKALEEKKIIKSIQLCVKLIPNPGKTEEEKQKIIDGVAKRYLNDQFGRNEELCDLFCEYAHKVGMETLVKELAIKPDASSTEARSKLLDGLIKILTEMKGEQK